jgi:hypothetical protein
MAIVGSTEKEMRKRRQGKAFSTRATLHNWLKEGEPTFFYNLVAEKTKLFDHDMASIST